MVWIRDVTYRFPPAMNTRDEDLQTAFTISALPPKFDPAIVARRNVGKNAPPRTKASPVRAESRMISYTLRRVVTEMQSNSALESNSTRSPGVGTLSSSNARTPKCLIRRPSHRISPCESSRRASVIVKQTAQPSHRRMRPTAPSAAGAPAISAFSILYGAFTRLAHAARSYSCKSPPRRSRRFTVIAGVPAQLATDVRPFGGVRFRLRCGRQPL